MNIIDESSIDVDERELQYKACTGRSEIEVAPNKKSFNYIIIMLHR